MAKAPTEEQSQLKRRARRRLVGSIALVTVVAVVLPWVMETEPRNGDPQIAIQIPSPDAGKFLPKAVPDGRPQPEKLPPETTPASPPVPVEPPKAAPVTADDALRAEQDKVLSPPVKVPAAKPAGPKDKPAEKPPEKRTAEPAKKAADRTETASERKPEPKSTAADKPYVVQVAALADADKAEEIRQALAAKGLKAYTEKVKTASGEVTRVRVGPFSGRDAAEKERGRMKSLGFDGNVAPR